MKKILLYLAVSLFLLIPLFALAAVTRGAWTLEDITDILDDVANWCYVIGFSVAIIVLIIGGIQYMTSGGDEEKQKSAKKIIITGLIGAAVILLAGVILDTVVSFFGVTPPA